MFLVLTNVLTILDSFQKTHICRENGQSLAKMIYIQATVEFSDHREIEHINFCQFNSRLQL
jgi:hypothetical protein